MTEFEIAQLEIMQVERNLSVIEAITSVLGLVQNDFAQWLTLLFGYLLVAYYIGANLTRVQVTILNLLYLAAVGLMAAFIVGGIQSARKLLDTLSEYSGESMDAVSINSAASGFAMALGLTLILASLYFMWSIRHPKTE